MPANFTHAISTLHDCSTPVILSFLNAPVHSACCQHGSHYAIVCLSQAVFCASLKGRPVTERPKESICPQEAGSARVREAQERLAHENSTLRAQLMETEAALLGEQEAVADLKHALAAAERRQGTPLKANQAVQVHCVPRKCCALSEQPLYQCPSH